MPIHDWTSVEAGIFHSFHTTWISHLTEGLNNGLLSGGYYALAEQHAGRSIADVLTLHASPHQEEMLPLPPDTGGIAVAEAPPRTRRAYSVDAAALTRRRSVAIRHVSGHRLVALLEIVSPGNKDRARHVEDFVAKALSGFDRGIHLLMIDLFPPGTHDPRGMHDAILARLEGGNGDYDLPRDEPLTLAAYAAGTTLEMYLEHAAVNAPLPDMPLFLRPDRYINVPLEATYRAAYRGMPAFWRDILEGGQDERR